MPGTPARIPVGVPPRAYQVRIGRGELDGAGAELAHHVPPGPALVVTDANVAPHYLERTLASLTRAGFAGAAEVLPPGEETKSLARVASLYDRLLRLRADRRTAVIALGGGVVSDLAGFAAATWLRGVPWLAVPTSLLAQADASVGGKTGVNLPAGKNLVGAFHQPVAVIADPDVLATLPARQRRSGLAEVVKAALGLSGARFEELERDAAELAAGQPDALARAVAGAVGLKAAIVTADEREGDRRRLLNLGHTAGHAIEAAAGYGAVLHGEAVAVGLMVAIRVAVRRRRLKAAVEGRVADLLRRLALPVDLADLAARPAREAIAAHLDRDKKRAGDRLALVLPVSVGASEIVEDGSAAEVLAAL